MKKFLLGAALLSSGFAFAHEGHGHTHGFTITHYMVETEHTLVLVLMSAVVYFVVRYFRKEKANR